MFPLFWVGLTGVSIVLLTDERKLMGCKWMVTLFVLFGFTWYYKRVRYYTHPPILSHNLPLSLSHITCLPLKHTHPRTLSHAPSLCLSHPLPPSHTPSLSHLFPLSLFIRVRWAPIKTRRLELY